MSDLTHTEAWLREHHVYCGACGGRMARYDITQGYDRQTGEAIEQSKWQCSLKDLALCEVVQINDNDAP